MKRKAPIDTKRVKNKPERKGGIMDVNYTMKIRVLHLIVISAALFLIGAIIGVALMQFNNFNTNPKAVLAADTQEMSYWFLLHRKSNIEYLYRGIAGDASQSELIRTFKVKAGIPGERPTPLPHLLRKEYFLIIGKMEQYENPETAPYFLTLDVPVSDFEPYGPTPYVECNGQCSWILPGAFGLHGVNGDLSKLSEQDAGSSGCIRHSDEDITYLYNILDPNKEEIRYYIKDI